ncbi:MAG: LVIVD repeat-containing protein [Gemmatimonadaceae bacterium]
MAPAYRVRCTGSGFRPLIAPVMALSLATVVLAAAGCATATSSSRSSNIPRISNMSPGEPVPDPRVGLRAGKTDAGTAAWNMRVVSQTPPSEKFVGVTNSDLAFLGSYAIQGNYNGYQVWDISDPAHPTLKTGYLCPASQSDVSVYRNLLFVSGEGLSGRIDCGTQGVKDTVSRDRLRGLRIFDISDINNPRNVGNVQTCRGSHTHTVLVDPKDPANVYVYISGSAGVRSPNELTGCIRGSPDSVPETALFRIEVIKVPLAHPEQAAIVSSPRIFNNLMAPARHGEAPEDIAANAKAVAEARAKGGFVATIQGREQVLGPGFVTPRLDSIVKARGGTGAPTAADSAALRAALPGIIAALIGPQPAPGAPRPGPTQCHDITVYPAIGLAGGACEGYGFLLDIRNPANPVRIAAVSDSNFSYWHSATFNNDGTKILFSDEWGGGGQPKCRSTDRREWGSDAIFTIVNNTMQFQSYYKLPAAQTQFENCVAHNGSLVPIPGRDVMVQAWYQGGISVFDWTDPRNPREIAYFDRGPMDSTRMVGGGSWSAYWYNGAIVSSEIARGLDIFELTPSQYLSQNEIDAAKSVHYDYLNTQGQPQIVFPPSFALARAYVDQVERSTGLTGARISAIRQALSSAESASGASRRDALTRLATQLDADAGASSDAAKVRSLARAVRDLAGATS